MQLQDRDEDIFFNSSHLTTLRGIYYLLKDKEVVYIGSSENCLFRVQEHRKVKDFDSFVVRQSDNPYLRDLETDEILLYKPRYNITLPTSHKWFNPQNAKRIFGICASQFRGLCIDRGLPKSEFQNIVYYNISDL